MPPGAVTDPNTGMTATATAGTSQRPWPSPRELGRRAGSASGSYAAHQVAAAAAHGAPAGGSGRRLLHEQDGQQRRRPRRAARRSTQPVYKIHLLSAEHIGRQEAQYRRTDPVRSTPARLPRPHLVRHLPTPEDPWLVVTIVREPVVRSASDFFQSGRRLGRLGDEATTSRCSSASPSSEGIPRTAEWFDRELAPTLGIDVYDHPFDPAVGYGDHRDALGAAAGAPPGEPRTGASSAGRLPGARRRGGHRAGERRRRQGVLRPLCRRPAAAPASTTAALDLAYGSRFARHFYSPAELDELRARWGRT